MKNLFKKNIPLNRNSVLKTTYFVGALNRISLRTDYKIGTIDEIKKLISNRIEYDKEYNRLDSSFVFTDKELFELIELYFEMGVIGTVENRNGKLIEIECENREDAPSGLHGIIYDKLARNVLTSKPIMLESPDLKEMGLEDYKNNYIAAHTSLMEIKELSIKKSKKIGQKFILNKKTNSLKLNEIINGYFMEIENLLHLRKIKTI